MRRGLETTGSQHGCRACKVAGLPANEKARLAALQRYNILETDAEQAFDSLTTLAAQICNAPIALISLVDENRQWFKSKCGLDANETSRDLAFCAHAILQPESLLIIPNALEDERFADNPLVAAAPHMRFYAGAPLITPDGLALGTLCIIDRVPRQLTPTQTASLKILADQVVSQLELRLQLATKEVLLEQYQQAEVALHQARNAANAANRAKSEFLANMSHELRTPLNTILGFTQLMMREGHFDAQSLAALAIVNRSGEHLLDLINDVLEMSKIEAGRVALHLTCFNLRQLLTSLEAMLQLRAQAKGLKLQFHWSPDVPVCIEADEAKLRQVLLNLLGNGIKFTAQGSVNLQVQVHPPPEVNSGGMDITLQFAIADTGPGIAPEEVDQLFEPFVQTATGHRSQEGTGLGLPISQQFVSLMGGALNITTALDHGSTFTFTLPVRVAQLDQALPPQPERSPQRLAPNQPECRILVVEDHDANRQLLVRLLSYSGFQVEAAKNGTQALELAQQWRPHLIWMDMRMPEMDGYEATRQIKAANLEPSPVILALTASAFEEERGRVIAAGCQDFVRKPFRHETLLEKIAEYLPIQYLYGDDLAETGTDAPAAPLPTSELTSKLTHALKQMPLMWQQQLQAAAMKGADEMLITLIKQAPQLPAPLAKQLTDWTLNFDFDAIIHLIQVDN